MCLLMEIYQLQIMSIHFMDLHQIRHIVKLHPLLQERLELLRKLKLVEKH